MVKYIKNKNAYSLIELVVVMAIIGLMTTLGIIGMMQFRRITEADQAVKEMASAIKETKTRAKNNSIDTTQANALTDMFSKSFGYQIVISKDQMTRKICSKPLSTATVTYDWSASGDCGLSGTVIENLKSSSFSNIIFGTISDDGLSQYCDSFIIENLTGRIYLFAGVNPLDHMISECSIKIKFKDDNTVFRVMKINTKTGDIVIDTP